MDINMTPNTDYVTQLPPHPQKWVAILILKIFSLFLPQYHPRKIYLVQAAYPQGTQYNMMYKDQHPMQNLAKLSK